MSRSHAIRSLAVAAACSTALLAGCAIEQEPINRVQPNYYDKTFFVGADFQGVKDDPEFYSQSTLVDVGYGAGQDGLFTSTYAQPLSRVKWQVTENLLIARLAYERVKDTDGKGVGKSTNDGIVVAAYPITRHFDIRRQYNPSTGEELNVIEENAVDRPWFERQFIRVDWSKNLSTDNYEFDTLSQMGLYGGVSYEPLAYDVTDPADEDAPHIDPENGYLDVTNKAFARPELVTLEQWGFTFPACFFDADIGGGGAPTTQCSPVELTIRNSFRKVTDHDYEPADWDGYRFQAFGAFTTDRKGYARDYGMTDTQWHRFINRYNLWERSHAYENPDAMTGPVKCFTPETTPLGADPHRDTNDDGTEDECAAVGNGSRCDTFSQKCTLPFRERKVRPVVWYYSEGSAPDYFDATREAAHEWDVVMRSSVMAARYTECVRTRGVDCLASNPMYFGQQDDNQDAIWLAKEVDDCRAGLYTSAVSCDALADTLGAERHMSPGVIALAKMEAEIERRLALQRKGSMLPFAILETASGRAVGMTTYMNIEAEHRRLEIGSTWYRKRVQRTALNTECKLLMLTHAFEALDCIAVEFRTSFFNHQSRKAIERLGAKLDGVLRSHRLMKEGSLRDTCVYSIIRCEWPAVKTHLQFQLDRPRA